MKLKLSVLAIAASIGSASADLSWNTNGSFATWTAANWSPTGSSPFTTAWVANTNVQFAADSTITFATTSIGNITVAAGKTVTVAQGGTLSTNGAVRTFDIGTGSTLTWLTQNVSANSTSGFIKSGSGIWNIGAQGNLYTGGFTLNAGTVIVSGNNSFGGPGSGLNISGGTIQSSGTRAYANAAITIGGNFTNSGTGNATFSGTIALGAATRTITNDTASGSRIYSGVISGTSGAGLTFAGAGAGQTYIGNASNSFTGTISVTGSEVGFASNGAFGNATNTIVVDGGRLSSATIAGAAATYTLASTHGIQVGAMAGTSISTVSGGVLTYDGVISDKSGSTGAWAKQGSGALSLGGISTYTGDTSINNGTLQLTTGNNRLPTGTVVAIGQAASSNLGTLDLNARSQQIAGLVSTSGTNATVFNNTVTSTSAATLTINTVGSNSYTYGDGTNANSGVITGAISLVKSGTGTQILGDANTYTGTTAVNAGKLVVTNSIGSSAVTVSGSGAILASDTVATLGSTLTIQSGAILAVGDAANTSTATATVTGATTFNNGSIFSWDINSTGTSYDKLISSSIAGEATAGDAVFRIVAADVTFADAFWNQSRTWSDIFTTIGSSPIADWAGIFGSTVSVVNSSFTTITPVGGSFTVSGNSLSWSAVPEPSSALAGILLGAGLLRRRRVV